MVNTNYNIIILPVEVTVNIVTYCDIQTLFSISCSCKSMLEVGNIVAKNITQLNDNHPLLQLAKKLNAFCMYFNTYFGREDAGLFKNLIILNPIINSHKGRLTISANTIVRHCENNLPNKPTSNENAELQLLIENGATINSLGSCLKVGFSTEIIELLLSKKIYLDKIDSDHILRATLNNYPEQILNTLTTLKLSTDANDVLCHLDWGKADSAKESQLQTMIDKGAIISSIQTCLYAQFSSNFIESVINRNCYSGNITLQHITTAISKKYPNYIIVALTSKLNDKPNDLTPDYLAQIISSELPHESIMGIIYKLNDIPDKYVDRLLWKCQVPEPIFLALLDRLSTTSNDLAITIWDYVFKKEKYTLEPMKKILDINSTVSVSFPLFKYDIEYCKKLYNDSFVDSLANNQTEMSLKFLNSAMEYKLSPQTLLNIYKKIPHPEPGMRENSYEIRIRLNALQLLFRSGIYEVIQQLNQLNEYPFWDHVTYAIEKKQDEKVIHELLEAYEKEEKSQHGACGFHYRSYSTFLESALEKDFSDSIVEKILNKVVKIQPRILELARQKNRSPELIERLAKKQC